MQYTVKMLMFVRTRLTLDIGYSRDIQKHIYKGKINTIKHWLDRLFQTRTTKNTKPRHFFRFLLGGAPNPTRPKSMGLTTQKSYASQSYNHMPYNRFSTGRLVPHEYYTQRKTNSQCLKCWKIALLSLSEGRMNVFPIDFGCVGFGAPPRGNQK